MHICAWQSADSRVTTDHCRVTLRWVFTKSFLIAWNVQKRCLTVSRRSRDLRPLSRDRLATFFKIFSNCLKRLKTLFDCWTVGRRSRDLNHCRVTVQRLFSKFSQIAWNVQKRCLTFSRRSRDLRPLSRDRSATFFKNFSNCLKRLKTLFDCLTVGRRSRDLNHCRVTVQRLFSKFTQIAWNVQKRCLTFSRRSRDLRPLSRDRSATFFENFYNCLKRPKNVVWQSADGRVTSTTVAWPFSDFFQNFPKSLETSKNVVWHSPDGRVTSDHCRVTVQRLFSKNFLIAWNVQKTLFDSRRMVAWPQPLSRDRSATFFKIFPNRLKRPKNVVWQSADGRVTSDHCRVTVQRLFSKKFLIAWNVQKTLFDSWPTVAWPQPLSRDRSATFFKIFPNRLKRPKNVVWQSADGRVTSDHCRVTVQRLFSKNFLNAWNVQKTLFDSRPTVAWPHPLSRDRSATFFKIFPNRLKRPKNVVWQSADGRVTSTTVAWPFSDLFQNFPKSLETSKKRCLTVGRRSRDLRPLSRDRSATFFKKFSNCLKRPKNVVWQSADSRVTSSIVGWPFSDFFQNSPKSLGTFKKRCLTVGRQSRDLQPLSRDRSATFFKIFPNRLKRPKTLFDSLPTVAWPPTTVAWPFSDFFRKLL